MEDGRERSSLPRLACHSQWQGWLRKGTQARQRVLPPLTSCRNSLYRTKMLSDTSSQSAPCSGPSCCHFSLSATAEKSCDCRRSSTSPPKGDPIFKCPEALEADVLALTKQAVPCPVALSQVTARFWPTLNFISPDLLFNPAEAYKTAVT